MPRKHTITQTLSPEYVILGLLALQSSHGYALHKRLETELRYVWRISLSQVYNLLQRMLNQGYIQERGESHSKRTEFQITAAGARHLDSWMRAPLGPSLRAVRMAFLTKLYLAQASDEPEPQTLIAEQRATITAHLEELEARAKSLPQSQIVNRLALQLRIKQLESLCTWFDDCTQQIYTSLEIKT